MLKVVRTFVQQAFGDIVVLPNPTTSPIASTPDRMLAGAVLHNLAAHFSDWYLEGKFTHSSSSTVYKLTPNTRNYALFRERTLTNVSKDLKVLVHQVVKSRDKDDMGPWVDTGRYQVKVNDLFLDEAISRYMVQEIERLVTAHETAVRVAEQTKAEMEAADKKWDLFERLTGFKREENGALVPVNTIEGE